VKSGGGVFRTRLLYQIVLACAYGGSMLAGRAVEERQHG
jgi:hypothetical protein